MPSPSGVDPASAQIDPDRQDLWEFASLTPSEKPLSEAEIRVLVRSRRRILRSLARATPEQRAAIYRDMGLRITYNPAEPDCITVEVDACTGLRVGGGT